MGSAVLEYEFHELADFVPDQEADVFADLVADMKKNGFDAERRITLYQGKILDGRHRYKASREAGVEPLFVEYTGDDPVGLVVPRLIHRNMTRGQKDAVILKLRGQGLSYREIQDKLKVSPNTIKSAIGGGAIPDSTSSETPDDPDRGRGPTGLPVAVAKTTGRDGKQYDATKPSKPAAPAKATPAPEPAAAGDAGGKVVLPRDRCGRLIPAYLVDTFAEGEAIRKALAGVRSARYHARAADKQPAVGRFLKRNPAIDAGLGTVEAGLARAVPYCVCPACAGDGDAEQCPTCGGCGWLNYAQYEHLPDVLHEQANHFKPGDAWEGDDEPTPPTGPPPAFAPPGPGLDGLGQKIPKQLRDVFADEFLVATAARLRQDAAALRSASAWNPWVKPEHTQSLDAAADHVEGVRPFAVCEACGGSGCEACLTGGFLPLWQRHELEREADEAKAQKKKSGKRAAA